MKKFKAFKEKGATFPRNPFNLLAYLAPRPGLEPGTYGLTENQARQIPI